MEEGEKSIYNKFEQEAMAAGFATPRAISEALSPLLAGKPSLTIFADGEKIGFSFRHDSGETKIIITDPLPDPEGQRPSSVIAGVKIERA